VSGFAVSQGRTRKAALISLVLERYLPHAGPGLKICDMGCGSGIIGKILSGQNEVVLQDTVDQRAARVRDLPFYRHIPKKYNKYFDAVLLNHVLPHAESSADLLSEAGRILGPGGLVYLALPNRWFPVEPIYRIPLIHWLPAALFNRMARICFPKRYEPVRHFSTREVNRLVVQHGFSGELIAGAILRHPEMQKLFGLNRITGWVAGRFGFFLPTQIWILRKGPL